MKLTLVLLLTCFQAPVKKITQLPTNQEQKKPQNEDKKLVNPMKQIMILP